MAGVASRRKSEELIKNNLIKVNNKIVCELGVKIDPSVDKIYFNNKILKPERKLYIIINKPIGYITSVSDNFNRPCVLDLINITEKIFPVGRLDFNTSGLLILTNDGEIAYKITHPKHKVNKTYIAKIQGIPSQQKLALLRSGILLDNKKTNPAHIEIISNNSSSCRIKIIISEGRNRQIRKMFSSIGYQVISLQRISIGNLFLNKLAVGHYKFISASQIIKQCLL
jgi:23S rRNA pseudouridine2605 synthase